MGCVRGMRLGLFVECDWNVFGDMGGEYQGTMELALIPKQMYLLGVKLKLNSRV